MKKINLPKNKKSASQINTSATKGSPDKESNKPKKLPGHSGGSLSKEHYSC